MRGHTFFVHYFLIFFIVGRSEGAGVLLKKLENCDSNPNDVLKINATIKTIHQKQFIDGTVLLKRAIDNSMHANSSINMLNGKQFVHVFDIHEKRSCIALHRYMGEFIYQIERNAGLISGMCPIPKGKHEIHNAPLDFSRHPTMQVFPFGYLQTITLGYDDDNNILSCILVELEHRL